MDPSVYPLKVPAIKVEQPLGTFFVVTLSAAVLKSVTYLDPTRIDAVDLKRSWYRLLGAQRPSSKPRSRQIGKYIDTEEAAFPNSIILSANYIDSGGLVENEEKRWAVSPGENGVFFLTIPSSSKMASVVDGQHRLLGYDHCRPERLSMNLLCAVYMDLPQPYQAYLFATININQRKVDKSLAYDQFGYNLDDEINDSWAPDKLAVFLTRKLNLESDSPFFAKVRVAPLDENHLLPESNATNWQVSMACMVDGISKLISTNPKKDRDNLHRYPVASRARDLLEEDQSPLRDLYLEGRDDDLKNLVKRYFNLVQEHLWNKTLPALEADGPVRTSYIMRTIGIQALFDVLRRCVKDGELLVQRATDIVTQAAHIDFSDPFYQASGKGRVRVKNSLLLAGGLMMADDIEGPDSGLYREILQKSGLPT